MNVFEQIIAENTDADSVDDILSDGAYTLGQYKELSTETFDVEKAIKKYGISETTLLAKEFVNEGVNGNFPKSLLGISNQEKKTFVINPKDKEWISTFFHEVGHIIQKFKYDRGLGGIEEYIFGYPKIEAMADLFAYFVIKELKIERDWKELGHSIRAFESRDVTEKQINEVKADALAFIQAGAK